MKKFAMTAVFVATLPLLALARERACCRYSCQQGSVECPDHCDDSFSCVIKGPNNVFVTESECEIERDSKKDKEEEEGACLAEQFTSSKGFTGHLPFRVLAYPFSGVSSQSSFVGVDVRFAPSNDTRLRFRVMNKSPFCGSSPSLCHPRCVTLSRPPLYGHHIEKPLTELSYDCEVGFLIQGKVWRSTAGDDYELAVCSGEKETETCGLFSLRLPEAQLVELEDQELVLLNTVDGVVAHVPLIEEVAELHVELVQSRDNMTSEVVEDLRVKVTPEDRVRGSVVVKVTDDPPYGRSQILVTGFDRLGNAATLPVLSATVTVPHPGHHLTALLAVVLVAILLSGVIFVIYRRWNLVIEAAAVEPQELVNAGQIEPVTLLVVTTLENPAHVEVVKLLCRYLRNWCGVAKTYFALDEDAGIGGGDPWKWCQETGDIVRQSGSILFIAGPDCSLSRDSSIHPNLEQNQAFLSTAHLQVMAGEGRLLVATFPYSDLTNLPQEVPKHLQASSYLLPSRMNDFLVALLRLQPLCGLSMVPSIKPDVRPANFDREGGPQLLAKVKELSQASLPVHKSTTYQMSEKEKLPLIDRKEEQTLLLQKNQKLKDETLQIELEEALPSVREMEDRDRFDTED